MYLVAQKKARKHEFRRLRDSLQVTRAVVNGRTLSPTVSKFSIFIWKIQIQLKKKKEISISILCHIHLFFKKKYKIWGKDWLCLQRPNVFSLWGRWCRQLSMAVISEHLIKPQHTLPHAVENEPITFCI